MLPFLAYAAAIIAFVANYVHSEESARKRLQWVGLRFICGFGGTAWLFIVETIFQFINGDIPL